MRVLAIILFAACGSREAETPSATAPASNEQPAETQAATGEPAEVPMHPGPAPVVDLRSVELEDVGDEGVSLQLRVPGPEAVELRRVVRIERENDGAWEAVDAEFSLRPDCEEPSSACLTLAAGAELVPPGIGDDSGQCGAPALEPGNYRFVVQSCAPDNTRPHELPSAFTLSP